MGGNRDHHLAGDITAQDHQIGLVKGGGVQEFPPADLRTVDVGCKEDLHATTTPYAVLPVQRVASGATGRQAPVWSQWIPAGSVPYFFGQLIPADPVPDIGPDP